MLLLLSVWDWIALIIHLGAPNDIESYIQETGRAGRDYQPALATLLVENRNNQYHDKSMLNYQKNNFSCHRDIFISRYR